MFDVPHIVLELHQIVVVVVQLAVQISEVHYLLVYGVSQIGDFTLYILYRTLESFLQGAALLRMLLLDDSFDEFSDALRQLINVGELGLYDGQHTDGAAAGLHRPNIRQHDLDGSVARVLQLRQRRRHDRFEQLLRHGQLSRRLIAQQEFLIEVICRTFDQ